MANAGVSSTQAPENLEAFWREMMEAKEGRQRNQFAMEHLPLVRAIAKRIHARLPNVVELEDLVQEGMLGLHLAMLAYDPRRAVRFTTFAPFYIRGAILDHLRKTDWAPRLVRQRARMFEKAKRQLQQRLRRSPSEAELADHLSLSSDAFKRLCKDEQPVSQVSLSEIRPTDKAGLPIPQAAVFADPHAPDPAKQAQQRDLRDFITRSFNRTERLVLTLYYYEHMTMKEIGMALDLSESRVSQIRSSVLSRLKARLAGKEQALALLE